MVERKGLDVLVVVGKVAFEVDEEGNFLFKVERVVFKEELPAGIFSLHFFDVVKLLFVERQYLCAVIEKHAVRVVAQDVTDSVFGAVIDPLFDRNVLNFRFVGFC